MSAPLRVAAITPGQRVPSARFRVRQLVGALADEGVALRELIPPVSSFPPAARWVRPFWGAAALSSRLPLALATHRYDMTLIQREMISTFATLEGWTRRPRVFDVDDAIFLLRGGRAAERIARLSDAVICGNEFLADWFSKRNPRVSIIPTAVDTSRYRPPRARHETGKLSIGWIGTASNLEYLHRIEPALDRTLGRCPGASLLVVSDARPRFRRISPDRIEFRPWSEDRELEDVHDMAIGIMPLVDSPWARGKCSFKMLLYMACGIPVVASPVGSNAGVFALGRVGIPAATDAEWADALISLVENPGERNAMGRTGRAVAEAHYDVRVIARRVAECLLSVAVTSR